MRTLTTQLRKKAIKKRASHPSSIRELDLDFKKLADKLEQAETTMKLEEIENLKLENVKIIQTTTTQINHIHNSDLELSEKITKILNIYEKNPNFKGKPAFKNWSEYFCEDTDIALMNADKKNKETRINHKSTRNQTNHFIST